MEFKQPNNIDFLNILYDSYQLVDNITTEIYMNSSSMSINYVYKIENNIIPLCAYIRLKPVNYIIFQSINGETDWLHFVHKDFCLSYWIPTCFYYLYNSQHQLINTGDKFDNVIDYLPKYQDILIKIGAMIYLQ